MLTHRGSATIQLSRRALASALLAATVLGVGIGEAAAPLASSQAQVAKVAAVPAACASFATNVGTAFEILGSILEDASKYPALVPKAEQAGAAKSAAEITAIATKLKSVNTAVEKQASRFAALKGPILSEETSCLR
jgi:hypothetical protein